MAAMSHCRSKTSVICSMDDFSHNVQTRLDIQTPRYRKEHLLWVCLEDMERSINADYYEPSISSTSNAARLPQGPMFRRHSLLNVFLCGRRPRGLPVRGSLTIKLLGI